MSLLRKLLSLIRFSHTLFALPFALLAAVMAWASWGSELATHSGVVGDRQVAVRWQEILGILLSMVFARSAAMAFNRLVDRDIDAANPRTSMRHLPAGELTAEQVATFAIFCGVAFVASTTLFLPNWLPVLLSGPVLAVLLGYSFAKRFTWLAHYWLGGALALAPIAAWIAIRGMVVLGQPADLWPAIVLGGIVLTWVGGFDIIYACQDVDFDRQTQLRSVPARFGVATALKIAAASHGVTGLLLIVLVVECPLFGWIFATGVAGVILLLLYEHWLVRPTDLSRVNQAFFQVNAVISIGLFAVGALDLAMPS